MENPLKAHWQKVYSEKAPEAVSWFQSVPARSLELIGDAGRVVDVGGGASTLVDHLVGRGVEVCVVDLAGAALAHGRGRLGDRARWVEGDVTGELGELEDGWADVWHDRAVFHFLTEPGARLAYAKNLARVLRPGGRAVIAAFAPDGPERCSGLPVCRHDAGSIAAAVSGAGRRFEVVESQREEHRTPWGSVQAFTYAVLREMRG